MNETKHVISLDVAKDEAMIGLFRLTAEGEFKTLMKPRKAKARRSEMEKFLKEARSKVGDCKLSAIMESTGVYHTPFMNFLRDEGLEVILINPTISKRFLERNGYGHTSLRENKDDRVDCIKLAQMFFSGNYNTQHKVTEGEEDLRGLASRIEKVSKDITSYKNTIRQLMMVIFPGYEEVYDGQSFFSKPSLSIMKRLAHPDDIKKATVAKIAGVMSKGTGQKRKSYSDMAEKLRKAAEDSLPGVGNSSAKLFELGKLVEILESLLSKLEDMEDRLISLVRDSKLFKVCRSFPGVGDRMAAVITALIGDINRFNDSRKLIAYMGFDPRRKQSGSSINSRLGISKRGSPVARHFLFMTVLGILMSSPRMKIEKNEIYDYYKKKRSGAHKHYYALVIACCAKLLRMIFGRYKDPSFKA